MKQFVDHLLTTLTPQADGRKRKVFKRGIDRFADFLDTFNSRNLAGDADLEKLIKQASALMKGVEVDDLKQNDAVRDSLQNGFTKIQESLAPLVIDAPIRHIDVDDLPDDATAVA
jgi:hypothetical protein